MAAARYHASRAGYALKSAKARTSWPFASRSVELTAVFIKGVVGGLREVLEEPDVSLDISIVGSGHFGTGFALKEFAKLAGIE